MVVLAFAGVYAEAAKCTSELGCLRIRPEDGGHAGVVVKKLPRDTRARARMHTHKHTHTHTHTYTTGSELAGSVNKEHAAVRVNRRQANRRRDEDSRTAPLALKFAPAPTPRGVIHVQLYSCLHSYVFTSVCAPHALRGCSLGCLLVLRDLNVAPQLSQLPHQPPPPTRQPTPTPCASPSPTFRRGLSLNPVPPRPQKGQHARVLSRGNCR